MFVFEQNTLSERRKSLTELLVQLLKERDQREAELRHRLVSIDSSSDTELCLVSAGHLQHTFVFYLWEAPPKMLFLPPAV